MRSKQVLDRLRAERDEARNVAIALAEGDDFDPKSDAYKASEERAISLDKQIERIVELHNAQDAADALDGRLSRTARQAQERDTTPTEARSIGDQFLSSDVWANYNLRGTSSKLEIEIEERALPHSLATMADVVPSGPIYDLTPPRPPDVLIPLCNIVTVSGNSIDYVTWAVAAGAAAVVAEGASKPEIEWEPTVTSASLENIAGRTSFTRQMADDLPAVRSFINGELMREVAKKVESQAKAALTAATLPTATGPAGAGLVGALRAGQMEIVSAGFNPNGFLVHPNDLIDLDLATMSQLGGAPTSTLTYWGMRPVVDPGATEGTVTVGDFLAGVSHYRRNSIQLFVTDSHASNFALNILDALAEQRCKTVVTRPDALCEATAGA